MTHDPNIGLPQRVRRLQSEHRSMCSNSVTTPCCAGCAAGNYPKLEKNSFRNYGELSLAESLFELDRGDLMSYSPSAGSRLHATRSVSLLTSSTSEKCQKFREPDADTSAAVGRKLQATQLNKDAQDIRRRLLCHRETEATDSLFDLRDFCQRLAVLLQIYLTSN